MLNACSNVDDTAFLEKDNIHIKDISYILYDLDDNKTVIEHNIEKDLIPASIFKLFTAYAALDVLGADKRFLTKIYYQGEIKNNILYGDLIIKGGGDPSLKYEDLYNLSLIIKNKNIKKITGRILYNNSYFPFSSSSINHNQPARSLYNPGISALTLKDNVFSIEKNEEKYFLIPDLDYLSYEIDKKESKC